jgi:NhaP-type Na+/H+ and K+/H+ antiporter
MVIARLLDMAFWTEFWFEYAVGFAFGWFIFQYKAMSKMADSKATALWMGGRAEFFSMMTVMAGMGVVMAYVTPLVIGEQPDPVTFGFWGFAALGLFLGFVVTYPMNWWLVQIGWKHGMS